MHACRVRQIAAVCLALWVGAVWMGVRVEGADSAPAAAQTAPPTEIEKGRIALTSVCQGCHGGGIMRMLESRNKSADEWRETVYRMIGRGAQVFPDEIEPMTAYLVATAGRGRSQQAAASPAAAAAGGRPQATEAAAILARRCQLCHDLQKATALPASQQWDAVIDRMVVLGAAVSPAEHQTLVAYLTTLQK